MAKAPVRPPAPSGDPFDHLAEVLRTLFANKLSAPEFDEEASDEDMVPTPRPDPVKKMRQISISILMPAKKSLKVLPKV